MPDSDRQVVAARLVGLFDIEPDQAAIAAGQMEPHELDTVREVIDLASTDQGAIVGQRVAKLIAVVVRLTDARQHARKRLVALIDQVVDDLGNDTTSSFTDPPTSFTTEGDELVARFDATKTHAEPPSPATIGPSKTRFQPKLKRKLER